MSSFKNTPARMDDEQWANFFDSDAFYAFFDLPRPKLELDRTELNAVEEENTELVNAFSEGEPIELSIEENGQMANNASSEGERTNEWSFEENEQFENALAEFDPSSPTFYVDVASRVPTKSIVEIINHYLDLVEDIDMIEAGLIEPPEYKDDQSDSKTKGKGKASSSKQQKGTASAKKRKSFAWTEEEHRMFLVGMDKFGSGDWRSISRYCVKSKSPTQIASHAQKYFRRLKKETSDDRRRRHSIHDIRSVTTTDTATATATATATTTTSLSIPPPDPTNSTEQRLRPAANNFSFNNITNASGSNIQQQSHGFLGHFHSSTSSLPLTRSTTFTGLSIPPPITTTTTSIPFPPIKEKTGQRLSHGFLNHHSSTIFTPTTTTMTTTAPSILFPPPLKDKSPQQPFPRRSFLSYNSMIINNANNNNREQSRGMGTNFVNSRGSSSSFLANSHGGSSSIFVNNNHRGTSSSNFINNYHGGGTSSSRPLLMTPTTLPNYPEYSTPANLNPSSTTYPSSSSSLHSPWSWFFQ